MKDLQAFCSKFEYEEGRKWQEKVNHCGGYCYGTDAKTIVRKKSSDTPGIELGTVKKEMLEELFDKPSQILGKLTKNELEVMRNKLEPKLEFEKIIVECPVCNNTGCKVCDDIGHVEARPIELPGGIPKRYLYYNRSNVQIGRKIFNAQLLDPVLSLEDEFTVFDGLDNSILLKGKEYEAVICRLDSDEADVKFLKEAVV